MAYTPILATLAYVLSPDGAYVLLIHRDARPDDPAFGKYNGLGGKLEADEDVASGMRRELREEASIEAEAFTLRGTISWPGFGKNGEDWFGFIFLVTAWTGTPLTGNHEGTLLWVPLSRLLSRELDLWPGDRYFLPLVFDDLPQTFHGVMPYRNGQPVGWSYTRL
jgi:8-oxo-dGTP diphosphatase